MSRVASDVFNDEFWHATPLPTEDEIREAVYCEQDNAQTVDWKRWPQQNTDFMAGRDLLCKQGHRIDEAKTITRLNPWEKMKKAFSNIFAFQGSAEPEARTKAQAAVLDTFRFQESAVLLSGEDKTDRLRQYNEQIVILRGGALNGIILCCVCAFGWCANWRRCLQGLMRVVTWVPAGVASVGGTILMCIALFFHSSEHNYSDPPLAEAVLTSIGLSGFVIPPENPDSRLYIHGFALGLVLTLILYGAWWWTEVLYDESVVTSSTYRLPAERREEKNTSCCGLPLRRRAVNSAKV